MPEIERVEQDASVKKKRRFDKRDHDMAAEFIVQDQRDRKSDRDDLEKQWKEIDRQVAMEPDISYKFDRNGAPVDGVQWHPEIELPDQVQTLEMQNADARRMIIPGANQPWFAAHAKVTDEYLRNVDFKSLIAGDENEVPSLVNQDNANKLVEGFLMHFHRQYAFADEIDRFNVGAFKYGTGLARLRLARKPVFFDTARGIERDDVDIPVLFGRSVKNVYLDTTSRRALDEGFVLSPSVIATWKQRYTDLALAANRGSSDPERMDGGWMAGQLAGFTPDKKGQVEVLEYEGDIVVPRKTVPSMVVRRFIWTVVVGQGDAKLIRLRRNPFPFLSWIYQPYQVVDPEDVYGVGPLMIGRPIQKAASMALMRLLAWAILNIEPPIKRDRDDAHFEAEGGVRVEPRAEWKTLGDVDTVQIGDGANLLNLFVLLLNKYADSTGVNAPRLGAQTVSHTTAFAKDAELTRGVIRTVDYVATMLQGGLTRFLYMEYEMALKAMGRRKIDFWSDAYGNTVSVTRSALPDECAFSVFGAGGPAEELAKVREKMAAVSSAVEIEMLKRQLGQGEPLDLTEIQRQLLREGGWVDVDPFFAAASQGVVDAGAGAAGVAGAGGASPEAVLAQLQPAA